MPTHYTYRVHARRFAWHRPEPWRRASAWSRGIVPRGWCIGLEPRSGGFVILKREDAETKGNHDALYPKCRALGATVPRAGHHMKNGDSPPPAPQPSPVLNFLPQQPLILAQPCLAEAMVTFPLCRCSNQGLETLSS